MQTCFILEKSHWSAVIVSILSKAYPCSYDPINITLISFRVYTVHLLSVCGLITVYCSVHLTAFYAVICSKTIFSGLKKDRSHECFVILTV